MSTEGNTKRVFVVQYDPHKDFSTARKHGELQAVFNTTRKPYNTRKMVRQAREVLKEFIKGDSLLMVGDPALCGVCLAIVAERQASVDVLNWDRLRFDYERTTWQFDEAVEDALDELQDNV